MSNWKIEQADNNRLQFIAYYEGGLDVPVRLAEAAAKMEGIAGAQATRFANRAMRTSLVKWFSNTEAGQWLAKCDDGTVRVDGFFDRSRDKTRLLGAVVITFDDKPLAAKFKISFVGASAAAA